MSEPRWTKGPYHIEESLDDLGIHFDVYANEPDEFVADCGTGGNAKDCAHLIAAAPELYRALELFVSIANLSARLNNPCLFTNEDYAVVAAKNALAKARGEQ